MATRPANVISTLCQTPKASRWHPFGAHGVLLALPLSLVIWGVIGTLLL
jgi:hypothetical protein